MSKAGLLKLKLSDDVRCFTLYNREINLPKSSYNSHSDIFGEIVEDEPSHTGSTFVQG